MYISLKSNREVSVRVNNDVYITEIQQGSECKGEQ